MTKNKMLLKTVVPGIQKCYWKLRAEYKNLAIWETFSDFQLENRDTGAITALGTPELYDVNDRLILVSTPAYYRSLQKDLEASYLDYMEAYFG